MKDKHKKGIPSLIGKTFAYAQHGIDKTIEWGFSTMQQAANAPAPKNQSKNLFIREAKRIGKGTLGFLGVMGTEYYKKYDELKTKKGD